MNERHQTIKIWRSTYLKLKRLAAQKPEKMTVLLDRLVEDETQRREAVEPLVGLEPTT